MAAVKTLAGELFLIQIGDGGGPEVFAHDCLINAERGIQLSADVADFVVPDCDNPDDPAWKTMFKDGLSAQVSGAGKLHTSSLETWFNWFNSDDAKNIRINFNTTGANGGGYIAGSFKLTSFNITGNRKALCEADITLVSTGALTWTDNA